MKKLVLETTSNPNVYRVKFTTNGLYIGSFDRDVDGYFKFFPDLNRGGYWPGWGLREIADLEDELNKEYIDELNKFFETSP